MIFLLYTQIIDLSLFSNKFPLTSSTNIKDTLEAALWCLLTTNSYSICVLRSVNLGGDTDTIAAIAGGLAGILYGFDAILTSGFHLLHKVKL